MVFKHTLCKTLSIICNRYLNMRRVFKPFLEVTHTASFMKLTVLTVYETLITSRVDMLSTITVRYPYNTQYSLLVSVPDTSSSCILTSVTEDSATA